MRILICNERFLFRFGVDRVLLILGSLWKNAGHEVIMMGNKLDSMAVDKCSDRFISIPEAPDYLHGNTFTAEYIKDNWDNWFDESNKPDVAFIAGWPFYESIGLLREKCGCSIFHDYGAVPTEGMNEAQVATQNMLRELRKNNLRKACRVIAISKFLDDTQAKLDVEGLIPTSYVHLGIDHLDMKLWTKDELDIEQNDVVKDIEKFKTEGYKIIFQPGRWEIGNYKNSPASFDIVRILKSKGHKVKVLVLSTPQNMGEVPTDLKDNFYCLGFVDDATMRKAMEISDLGLSPTLWEGFDLPLGEMQFLNKCMYVFNCGAHPEVAAHPYFMCENNEEMAQKISDELEGKLPFSKDELFELHEKFRTYFKWQRCADELLVQLEEAVLENTVVFIDVTNASHDTANSGVMRVTRKTSHYLQEKMNTIFILWDSSIRKYVFPYPAEVELLSSYGGPEASKIKYQSVEGEPRKLLDDVIDDFENNRRIHLVTETINYEILREAKSYFHSKGIYVAAIFYDAIAILRPELVNPEVTENHKKYMIELAGCDLVMPIAPHNQKDLENYWKNLGIPSTWVKTVDLAAEMNAKRITTKLTSIPEGPKNILFVSTLEPRKNHTRFLKAFGNLMDEHPELSDKVTVTLIGNRYAGNSEIPKFVEEFCTKYTNVKWLGVVDDETLRDSYTNATMTAYPSEIEGFGMPIIESLWFGKPCICSDSGSIYDLASPGGCCLTNVLDIGSIKASIYKCVTDDSYLLKLQNEATERDITTWNQYVDNFGKLFLDLSSDFATDSNKYPLPDSVKERITEYFSSEEANGKTRVIFASNFYPPNFVGGAEIIAHNQAKTLQNDGLARVMVFACDTTKTRSIGDVFFEEYEGLLVIRVPVDSDNFNPNGFNFFDPMLNNIFDEVCELVAPQILHCHNIIGMSLGMIEIAKKHGAKVCVTLHDNWGFCYKNTMLNNKGELCKKNFDCANCMSALTLNGMYIPIGVRQRYFKRIFENIDAYISPSSYLANTYIRAGFSYHKMNVLWNGIEVSKFDSITKVPSDKIRLTYIGYFGKHKGIDYLIRAVGSLKNKNLEINLVGAGEELDNYKILANECGIGNQVRYWGKIDNSEVSKVYAETDIYCIPSIWPENQPVSITEAMASGIPVIASNLGGSKELVTDGTTGFIFNAGDYEDLANKIKMFIDDRNLIKTMGEAGKEKMKENDFHASTKRLDSLYKKISDRKQVKRKGTVIFKNKKLPMLVDILTSFDIVLSDWIVLESDYELAKAFVLLPGEKLNKEERGFIKKYNIKLLAPDKLASKYTKDEWDITYYSSDIDLKKKIAAIR